MSGKTPSRILERLTSISLLVKQPANEKCIARTTNSFGTILAQNVTSAFLLQKMDKFGGGSEQKKNVWEAIDKFLDFVLKRRPHFWIKFLPCFILPFFLQLTSLCKFIVLICVFLPFEIIILLDNFVK